MTNPCLPYLLFLLVASVTSLPMEENPKDNATTKQEMSVSRIKRATPRHVFQCDGKATSRCENEVCQVKCDDVTVVSHSLAGLS